ncbi:MAG: sugar transferase [Alphaproteobacteria bacterium]|nr:sugar transferase [Alphaproteobacteria bacterium]MBU2270030.1 sugar transferase [Alphaproteobacteria bacterium]MBU2417873.1 sugar transferase [Alphaproteobacteria bacterium]
MSTYEDVALHQTPPGTLPSFETKPLVSVFIRVLDFCVSGLALIVASPLFLLIALAIKANGRGPIFYCQWRVGRRGRLFLCWKFRTMTVDAAQRLTDLLASDPEARAEWERDHKLRKDPRITPLGNFLRKTSLDEIPQLWCVLKGEMSLVGPRPIVQQEIWRYGRYFADYCSVRPGLTGLWQVAGRNDVSYRRRVALDVTYIRNRSVWLNIKILALTIPAVLLRRGY